MYPRPSGAHVYSPSPHCEEGKEGTVTLRGPHPQGTAWHSKGPRHTTQSTWRGTQQPTPNTHTPHTHTPHTHTHRHATHSPPPTIAKLTHTPHTHMHATHPPTPHAHPSTPPHKRGTSKAAHKPRPPTWYTPGRAQSRLGWAAWEQSLAEQEVWHSTPVLVCTLEYWVGIHASRVTEQKAAMRLS
jgi:hypothetical protein